MDRPGFEGAKFMCSPAPRDARASEGLWECVRRGTLDVVSSDHSGWGFETPAGKRVNGVDAPFRDIPNGIPGLGSRLPLLFSEGVAKGRIVRVHLRPVTSTNPAKLFGLYPRKGTIAPGADADLVLWDPARRVTITNALLQHVIDYTPYEGMAGDGLAGGHRAPRRGRDARRRRRRRPGSGRFLARGPYDLIAPTGRVPDGFDASAFPV